MHLQLNDFDKYVVPDILKRGKNYYKNGHILVLDEEEGQPGYWYAEVEGSYEDYDVNVRLGSDGQIELCDCSCPYDRGDICKHLVAVLLKIRDLNHKSTIEIKPSKKRVKPHGVQDMLVLYEDLTLPEQRILKILAVNWNPSTIQNLIHLYRECRFEKQDGKTSFTFIQSATLLFFSHNLVQRQGYDIYQITHPFADALCGQYFHADPDFKKIELVMRRSLFSHSNWYKKDRPGELFRNMRLGRYTDDLNLFKVHFIDLTKTGNKEFSPNKLLEYWVGEGFNKDKWEALGRDVRFFYSTRFLISTSSK